MSSPATVLGVLVVLADLCYSTQPRSTPASGRLRADGESAKVLDLYLREHGTEPGEHAAGKLRTPP